MTASPPPSCGLGIPIIIALFSASPSGNCLPSLRLFFSFLKKQTEKEITFISFAAFFRKVQKLIDADRRVC